MTNATNLKRWTAGAVIAAVALATVAPAAEAGRKHVRYKGGDACVQRVVRPAYRTVYVERHGSSVAPVLAGLIGGFVLGTVVSNAAPAAPAVQVEYSYFDPYCDVSFGTLDRYDVHLRRHHHPRVIRVIDMHSGDCVDTYGWRDGGWRSERGWDRDRDWDD